MPSNNTIWTVHQIRANEVYASEAAYSSFDAACHHARELSRQPTVLAAAVTGLLVDEPGIVCDKGRGFFGDTALYVDAVRQKSHWISDDKTVYRWGQSRWVS